MYIEFHGRHLAIGSRLEAEQLVRTDKKFWNVISICSPTSKAADLRDALKVHPVRFEDTEDMRDGEAVAVPRVEVIASALQFAKETEPGALLIHCQMGWSRSTAIALLVLVQKQWPGPDAVAQAIESLLLVRERSRPNHLILELGFGLFMTKEESKAAMELVAKHPQFLSNRLETSSQARRPPFMW